MEVKMWVEGQAKNYLDKITHFGKEVGNDYYQDGSTLPEKWLRNVTANFVLWRNQQVTPKEDQIAFDIGGVSNDFIDGWHHTSRVVNVNPVVVEALRNKGQNAMVWDIESDWKEPRVSVDVIFLYEIIEHLVCPTAALSNCRKLLNPDGRIFVTIPHRKQTHIHPPGYIPNRPQWQQHIHEFNPQDFQKIVQHAGLTIQSRKQFCPFMNADPLGQALIMLWNHFREEDMIFGCFTQFDWYELDGYNRNERKRL
jgi:SAM-dependent methyltransferase